MIVVIGHRYADAKELAASMGLDLAAPDVWLILRATSITSAYVGAEFVISTAADRENPEAGEIRAKLLEMGGREIAGAPPPTVTAPLSDPGPVQLALPTVAEEINAAAHDPNPEPEPTPEPEIKPKRRKSVTPRTRKTSTNGVAPHAPTRPPYPACSGLGRPYQPCTKCGSMNAPDVSYQPAGTTFTDIGVEPSVAAGAPEWLLRTCTDCGYQWPELTANTPDVYAQLVIDQVTAALGTPPRGGRDDELNLLTMQLFGAEGQRLTGTSELRYWRGLSALEDVAYVQVAYSTGSVKRGEVLCRVDSPFLTAPEPAATS